MSRGGDVFRRVVTDVANDFVRGRYGAGSRCTAFWRTRHAQKIFRVCLSDSDAGGRLAALADLRYLIPGSDSQLLHFIVVILAVKYLPFLAAFQDNFALGLDLLTRCLVNSHLFDQKMFKRFARFLPDSVAVFQKFDFVNFRQSIGDHVGQLIQLVTRDSHSTALYLRASSCLTFLNISG